VGVKRERRSAKETRRDETRGRRMRMKERTQSFIVPSHEAVMTFDCRGRKEKEKSASDERGRRKKRRRSSRKGRRREKEKLEGREGLTLS